MREFICPHISQYPLFDIFRVQSIGYRLVQQVREKDEIIQNREDRPYSLSHTTSSIWIFLLSIGMILSAIGDTGFAFSTAYGPDAVQRDVWVWNVIYNADHLCLAAALIGYGSFFSFRKQGRKSDSLQSKKA